mgnify:CR=1 FL=1
MTNEQMQARIAKLKSDITAAKEREAALAAALEKLTWRPLESIPRNVGVLLRTSEPTVEIGFFGVVSVDGGEYEDFCIIGQQNSTNLGRLTFTHWMPLPYELQLADPAAILATLRREAKREALEGLPPAEPMLRRDYMTPEMKSSIEGYNAYRKAVDAALAALAAEEKTS